MRDRYRSPLLFGACTVIAWWLALFAFPLWFPRFPAVPPLFDMSNYYVAARIGIENGWSHIYDLGLQSAVYHHYFAASEPFGWKTYFVSPPAVAWLMAPFAVLQPGGAYLAWIGLIFAGGIAAWRLAVPARGLAALLHLLAACTLFPVLLAFEYGNFVLPLACLVVVAWWLLRREREVAAGLVLLAIGLKPQVAVLVPLAVLVTGHRRAFVTWAVGSVVLAGLELASLGPSGIAAWRSDLGLEQAVIDNQVFTVAYLTGPGAPATILELACGALALIALWLNRKRGLELAIATALLGSLLASGYVHALDHVTLIPAFWLNARSRPPAWQYGWFGAGAVALLLMGHIGPAPVLVFELGWLVLCVTRPLFQPVAKAPDSSLQPASAQ